jgi:hypothetical protein
MQVLTAVCRIKKPGFGDLIFRPKMELLIETKL